MASAGSFPTVGWAQALLAAGTKQGIFPKGAATNANDLSAVTGWEIAEGTYGEYQNPLDTTLREPGSTNQVYTGTPGVYVQGYTSASQGIAASLSTLQGYPKIVADLSSGAPAQTTASDISGSSWGTEPFTPSAVSVPSGSGTGGFNIDQIPGDISTVLTSPGAGISALYNVVTGNGSGSGSANTSAGAASSGGGLLAKIGAFLIGGALLIIGIIILTKNNAPPVAVEGAEAAAE